MTVTSHALAISFDALFHGQQVVMKLSTAHTNFLFSLALGAGLLSLMILACSVGFSPEDPRLTAAQPPIEFDEEGEGPRSNWFYAQRAYPLNAIPHAARMRAIEQLELEEARLKARHAATSGEIDPAQSLAWVPLGPAPIGQGQTFGTPRVAVSGRVSTVVFDPGYNGSSNQTVYLGAAQGGVWRSRDNGATWTPLTDDQPSLAMGAIAIDPTNPNIIYAGTGEAHFSGDSYYGAGLLKSADGGATWMQITGPISASEPKQPAFLNAAFHALVIDPAAPSTLYAATATGLISSASGSTTIPPLIGDRGVWKSTDGGLTWRNLNPANLSTLNRAGTDVLLDPRDSRRVFAAISELGIYRSIAGGEPGTWEKLTAGLPASDLDRIELAVGPPLAPSTNSTLYAAISRFSNTRLLGVFKSTDGGATWTQTTTPAPTTGGTFYALALAVDPVDANVVYYGTLVNATNTGGTLWRSRDGGQTWVDLSMGNGASGGLHADTHWIAVNPANRDLLFTANDGGVWRTDSATADVIAWTSLNQSLNLTQFYAIALHPTDPNTLLGGTQDNGTDRYDGDLNWFHSRGGDGGAVLIDQSNPQVMYHTFINRNNAGGAVPVIGPEISFNSGGAWTRRGCFGCAAQMGNFNPADRLSDYAPMAQHTGFTGAQGNVIYFGTHRLYRSADQGVTWTGLGASTDGFGADLTKTIPDPGYSNGFPSYLSAIAAHPALDQSANPPGEMVWVGTGDGLVQFTTNAGALTQATFTNVTKAPLPNRYVTDIALDPNYRRRAVVVYSGFNTNTPATPGHVFMTDDQGATWANISGNLPDIPVNSVVIDPLLAGAVYIGTDLGVFQTMDGGATWIRLSSGMPKVAVFMLRYAAANRSLVAATHGRGVFRLALPIPRVAATVSAASFSPEGLASEAIVAAFGANLAPEVQVATAIPLPTSLAGTSVIVRDSAGIERLAPLFFVSPAQVNYQIPPGTTIGSAMVTIANSGGAVSASTGVIVRVGPGLFVANGNGQGVAAAVAVRVKADGSQSFEPVATFDQAQNRFVPVPIDLGPPTDTVVLVLFGTGLRNRSAQSAVNVKLGGVDAAVQYASAAPGFVGLDQVNVVAPRALAGRGEIDVALTADGRAANMLRLAFR
ncbi:MAG: hypothetical protein ACRD9Y_16400 [Blastocatellia bacterium]